MNNIKKILKVSVEFRTILFYVFVIPFILLLFIKPLMKGLFWARLVGIIILYLLFQYKYKKELSFFKKCLNVKLINFKIILFSLFLNFFLLCSNAFSTEFITKSLTINSFQESIDNKNILTTINFSDFYTIISLIILAPIIEEILFRFFWFRFEKFEKNEIKLAIFSNVLLFIIIHMGNNIFSFLCVLFLKTQNLFYSIIFHMLYNLHSTLVNMNLEKINVFLEPVTINQYLLLAITSIVFLIISIYMLNKELSLKFSEKIDLEFFQKTAA